VNAEQVRGAIRVAAARVDAASRAVAVHLEDVSGAVLDEVHDAFWAHEVAQRDRLIYELGRHLPGLAPALRALAEHIGASDEELEPVGRCCRDDD